MTSEHTREDDLWSALEAHEAAVKRSVESFGAVEAAFDRAVDAFDGDEEALGELERIGRALETHERRLEALVETLDERKGALRRAETDDPGGLAATMERARRRARQEPQPPGGDREQP